MNNSTTLENAGGRRKYARIDQETFAELNTLFNRVVDTLGTIAPVLELAKKKNATEKARHLRAVVDLAFRGHHALKAFSRQWALVLEENEKPFFRAHMEDFADIIDKAKQIAIPDQPPSLDTGKTEATHPLQEVAGMDPPAISDQVRTEAAPDLG